MTDQSVKPGPFTLGETYAFLGEAGGAVSVPVDADFWSRGVEALPAGGRLVSAFRNAADWEMWERHPAGEEIVLVLSGVVEFVLERPVGEQRMRLAAGAFVIVPRGVWHTANVIEPGEALFITPGDGTEHRPR